MAVRPPKLNPMTDDPLAAAFRYEAAADMAYSLGRAGRRAEAALAALKLCAPGDPVHPERLREAAQAVHAWFIQRELIGLRRHDAVIREMGIPNAVLARLGVG